MIRNIMSLQIMRWRSVSIKHILSGELTDWYLNFQWRRVNPRIILELRQGCKKRNSEKYMSLWFWAHYPTVLSSLRRNKSSIAILCYSTVEVSAIAPPTWWRTRVTPLARQSNGYLTPKNVSSNRLYGILNFAIYVSW